MLEQTISKEQINPFVKYLKHSLEDINNNQGRLQTKNEMNRNGKGSEKAGKTDEAEVNRTPDLEQIHQQIKKMSSQVTKALWLRMDSCREDFYSTIF